MIYGLLLGIGFLFYWWLKCVFNFWKDHGIPQVDVKLPFGMIPKGRTYIYSFQETYDKCKGKTSFVGLYNYMQPMLMVIEPNMIKQILVKDFKNSQNRGPYHNEKDDPLSAHLFNVDNPKWRLLRQKLSPTFTSGKMKLMFPIVLSICERFKEVMDAQIVEGVTAIEMREMFARFTTDVIGSCAFGVECNALNDEASEFRRMGLLMFTQPRHKKLNFFLMAYPDLCRKLGVTSMREDVSNFFIKMTEETVKYRKKSGIRRNDFIDLLIDLSNSQKSNSIKDSEMEGLSLHEIAAQCFVFFAAGFETSSSVSSFTVYELAQNQDLQDKLRAHIREVQAKHNGQLTYEALKGLTYLEQCINEGLRKYPSLPLLERRVTEPYQLPQTKVVLPVGTKIGFPMYAIHNDPSIFPNPAKFDPDRFTPEEIAKRPKCSFLPFGDGPRNCIGERFGMMQAKIGLAYMIGNYRFKLNPKTNPIRFTERTVVLAPAEGLYFDVEKID